MKLRAERAKKNPAKDAERQAQLAPYEKAWRALTAGAGGVSSPRGVVPAKAGGGTRPPPEWSESDAFRWLIEEFRVSLFAQDLGTAEPVSAVKLDRVLAALRAGGAGGRGHVASAPAPAAKPIISTLVAAKKIAPLKNLGALDKLFGR